MRTGKCCAMSGEILKQVQTLTLVLDLITLAFQNWKEKLIKCKIHKQIFYPFCEGGGFCGIYSGHSFSQLSMKLQAF